MAGLRGSALRHLEKPFSFGVSQSIMSPGTSSDSRVVVEAKGRDRHPIDSRWDGYWLIWDRPGTNSSRMFTSRGRASHCRMASLLQAFFGVGSCFSLTVVQYSKGGLDDQSASSTDIPLPTRLRDWVMGDEQRSSPGPWPSAQHDHRP